MWNAQGSGSYQIKLEKRAEKALLLLADTHEAAFFEATAMLSGHISTTPRKMMPPRLKELTGSYKANYQLDLAGNHRLIYTVDDDTKTVYVRRLGPHPDWSKRGRSNLPA